eukprot:g36005.t1
MKEQEYDYKSDSMFRHLEAMEALRNFSEFRQEASMLHSMQHPCIVSLVGISIHPLCFALELAPLGSLNTVLTDYAKETVNVKLSDYGISRQSFHEGALGVEGTPGYQAPEVMPGIVYDEK